MSLVKKILVERDRGVDVKKKYATYFSGAKLLAAGPQPQQASKPTQGELFEVHPYRR